MATKSQVDIFEDLKQYLITNFNGKLASGGKEVTIRCPFCGDSLKNTKDRHMYIGINRNTGIINYNCFLCDRGGMVNQEFFKYLGGDTVDINNDLKTNVISYNTKILNLPQNKLIKDAQSIIFAQPRYFIRDDDISRRKIDIFNKRLGINATPEELCRMKVIPNLKDFLMINNITTYTRHPNVVDLLDQFFIGFLSTNNSFINLRRLVPSGKLPEVVDKKYINYNIFSKMDNSMRNYTIPSAINTLDPRPIKIYIAEGSFDVLGLYYNVVEDKTQTIFSSIGGKSYLSPIKYFVLNYGLINTEYHICVDNDIDDKVIQNISNIIRPLCMRAYMHRNAMPGEKDFGVTRDRIKDWSIRLI